MFAGVCVGGWDRSVGEVVVFGMGTRLLTAATGNNEKSYTCTYRLGIYQTLTSNESQQQSQINNKKQCTYLP